jgi:UDP-N-acetylglucosamine/UDP-N-acetylgalactosamine diphosphorylase
VERAGAVLSGGPGDSVELSPLVSYAGEGLEKLRGKTLTLPLEIRQLND